MQELNHKELDLIFSNMEYQNFVKDPLITSLAILVVAMTSFRAAFGLYVCALALFGIITSSVSLQQGSAIGNRCPTVWQRSEGINLCIGTELNDHIDGSKSSDIIIGLAGDDLLRGGPADDAIQAGADDDKVYGNDGNDNMQGGPGLDQLYGGSGDDILFGGFDDDFISAGPGNDELYGGDGDDVLQGGPGADYFDCGSGFDIVIGFNPAEGDTNANNCEDVIQHL